MKRALKQFAENTGPDQADLDLLADLAPCCLLTESMGITVCINKQRMPGSDCMDVHVYQDLHCSQMIRALLPHCASHTKSTIVLDMRCRRKLMWEFIRT